MAGGSLGIQRITEAITKSDDAFENRVVQNVQADADLASHYPFSPERWHLYVNGTRRLIQYNDAPEYTDLADAHVLAPQSSGDVVTLESTETYRYTVGYVLEWSLACEVNQTLGAGDVFAVGYGDPDLENTTDDTPGPSADGWFIYWNSTLSGTEAIVAQYRDGTPQYEETVELERAASDWIRYESRVNWYGVGRSEYRETYTNVDDSEVGPTQSNDVVARTAIENERGPLKGNHRIRVSLKAESGAGTLEGIVGSASVKTLGARTDITREKTHSFTFTPQTANTWLPAHAMRVSPDQPIVNVQIANTDIVSFSDAEDVIATVQVFAESNVLDTNGDPLTDANYTTPDVHNPNNSVMEISSDAAQVADQTGTPQTSMDNPGGYQVGYSSWYTTGTGSKTNVASGAKTRKRQLPDGDVAVVLVNATTTGTPVVGEIVTEQDW